MNEAAGNISISWSAARLVAACMAVDPVGTGGVVLKGLGGPSRERWLSELRALLSAATPMRRIPLHISDDRLLGGLDLSATLAARRPVLEQGCLVQADRGFVLLASAERLAPETASRLVAVIDRGEVVLERDGLACRTPTTFGVVAFDEGVSEEEHTPVAVRDRLGFCIEIATLGRDSCDANLFTKHEIEHARSLLPRITCEDAYLSVLCETAMTLGVASLRACAMAVQVARVVAALDGRCSVAESDLTAAAQLTLAHRATRLPVEDEKQNDADEPPEQPDADVGEQPFPPDTEAQTPDDLSDLILEATKAAIPAGLLAALAEAQGLRRGRPTSGKSGATRKSLSTGRPAGIRRGKPVRGARLNLVETLRAAAPWQSVRARELGGAGSNARVQIRLEDFHITVRKDRQVTTTIFVVDASGSSALHRLAEAKGAVELLLRDCYVRRDQVALIAFRGRSAELILPPTRSLLRARRSLAAMPGGGGTPLAAAIDEAATLADAIRRKGQTPAIVLLTDGRANIARDGSAGRGPAETDALSAARALRLIDARVILIDTSPTPQPQGQRIATEMRAQYLALPHADAAAMSRAVLATSRAAIR